MHIATQKFRYQFFKIWRTQTSISTISVIIGMTLLPLLAGQPVERPSIFTSSCVAIACAFIMGLVAGITRFTVSCEGLRTFGTFGRWRLIPWSAIAEARPKTYYFQPHIRLTVDGLDGAMWVPLFLHDMQRFRSAVIAAAGADNPLSRALPIPAQAITRQANS